MLVTKKNVVYVTRPNIKSRAALILLNKRLRDHEVGEWLQFRDEFLNKRPMVCEYCGRKQLTKEIGVLGQGYLATIDHVMPLSKGGSRYDEANLKVACFPCNRDKSDKIIGV